MIILLSAFRCATAAETSSLSISCDMPKSKNSPYYTFQHNFININTPMFDNRLNLILNIFRNSIPFFQQILECKIRDGIFNNTTTNTHNSISQWSHSKMCKMWKINMIIYTWIYCYLDIIYDIMNGLPFVIKFCFGRSITDIRQSMFIIYSAKGFTYTRPGYKVFTYLLYLNIWYCTLEVILSVLVR